MGQGTTDLDYNSRENVHLEYKMQIFFTNLDRR